MKEDKIVRRRGSHRHHIQLQHFRAVSLLMVLLVLRLSLQQG